MTYILKNRDTKEEKSFSKFSEAIMYVRKEIDPDFRMKKGIIYTKDFTFELTEKPVVSKEEFLKTSYKPNR